LKIRFVNSAQSRLRKWRCDGALLVMPFTDAVQAERAAGLMAMRAAAPGLLLAIHDEAREGFIGILNRLFMNSDSTFFGYVAQDAFAGRCWLNNALGAMKSGRVQLLALNDGRWFGTLAVCGLVRRSWAKQVYEGSLFFPDYRRDYADTELSMIAASQHALGYAHDSVLIKLGCKTDSRKLEEPDRLLFEARFEAGFDGRLAPAFQKHGFGFRGPLASPVPDLRCFAQKASPPV